jgi:RNA polymerase sigma-70 factor, ECF subfamily
MKPTDATSLSLLARLHDSADDDAWERFQAVYAPLIEKWLVWRGVLEQDAADIRQEVMRIAVCELPRFEHSGRAGALRCWLRQTVGNQLRAFWRRKARQPEAVGGSVHQAIAEQLQDPASQLSRAWDEEYRRTVCRHLLAMVSNEFEGKTMEAFRQVALEEKRPVEVASDLGMTPNAVRIAQSRILRRLREIGQGMFE